MKKFWLFALAAFMTATASAQVVTSTSFSKARSGTVWYLKAGANIANMKAEGGSADAIFGYHVGLEFDRPVGGSGVFWNSGLLLATKGYKAGGGDVEMKLNANKLEIPLTFGYKYRLNGDIAIDGRLGGFANFDVFGKEKVKYGGEEESISLGDLEDYDRFSAGVQFGVGVWYQKLNLNITYQNGLVKQNEMKEKNWMISLGYAF